MRIRDARAQVRSAAERVQAASGRGKAAAAAEALDGTLTAVEEALYQTKNQSSQDPLNFPIRLNDKRAALEQVLSADLASFNRLVREQDVPAVVIKGAH